MKLSFILPSLLLAATGVLGVGNRTSTNGWGSTPAQRHYIDAAQAGLAIRAAVAYSEQNGLANNIAIYDPSSQLVAFLRMDNAYLGSVDISMKKAKTVTYFNGLFPSYGLYNRSKPAGDLWGIEETNGGLVVFGGGQPIYDHAGYFIGAIGVSGGTVTDDVNTAVAGAQAIGTTLTDYTVDWTNCEAIGCCAPYCSNHL